MMSNNRVLNSLIRKHESFILYIVVLCIIGISLINPNFLSFNNFFSIFKSSIVIGILALGVLLVLISGGIDVSFPVVAAFSLYVSLLFFRKYYPEAPVYIVYFAGVFIGGLCGLINGVLIALFRFPTLVVTLGTGGLISGFMYTFLGTKINHDLPHSLIEYGKSMFWVHQSANGQIVGMPTAIWLLIILVIAMHLFLTYTMLGRYIYAIGGSEVSAERAGISIVRVKIIVYILVGMLAGIAGITRSAFLRIADPFELYGDELIVIAATVLGGAYIGGGRGTVIGTILGVLLIIIINNSLIIIGIPSYWQKVAVGIILLFAVSIPIYIRNRFR